MAHLSIRKLPPDLDRVIQKEARRRGTTKTEVVLDALQNVFHLKKSAAPRRNVREFFGKMTPEDYREFISATKGFSEVDEVLWK